MAYTTADLDAIITRLESALGTGAAVIVFEGRRVEYRTASEISRAITYFNGLRETVAGTSDARIRQIRMYSDKGL